MNIEWQIISIQEKKEQTMNMAFTLSMFNHSQNNRQVETEYFCQNVKSLLHTHIKQGTHFPKSSFTDIL